MDIRDTGQGHTRTAPQASRGGPAETRRSQIQAAMYRKAAQEPHRRRIADYQRNTRHSQMQPAMDIRTAGQGRTPPLAGVPAPVRKGRGRPPFPQKTPFCPGIFTKTVIYVIFLMVFALLLPKF
jgi:hypothetical protein